MVSKETEAGAFNVICPTCGCTIEFVDGGVTMEYLEHKSFTCHNCMQELVCKDSKVIEISSLYRRHASKEAGNE